MRSQRRIQFRIPIAPTDAFYSQVRFFNFALRRLGGIYESARIVVVVGHLCALEKVIADNQWSEPFDIVWTKVPDPIFESAGVHGNANWRLVHEDDSADIIIFSDADTVLLQDIDPLLSVFPIDRPAIRGHMAHFPPHHASTMFPPSGSPEYWPTLFKIFEAPWPPALYRYSMDEFHKWPEVPAYFNYGFVVANNLAVKRLSPVINHVDDQLGRITGSMMRCQIALSVLAARHEIDIQAIGAEYNTANDLDHMRLNKVTADKIRVLHYLRSDELDRYKLFAPEEFRAYRTKPLANPANLALLDLVEEYTRAIVGKH